MGSQLKLASALMALLNSTDSASQLKQSYCINPASDDQCPFGYCTQPDITGLLVRISAYVTNFCLGSLMLDSNNPERALWSQLFIVASIIISCLVSTAQRSITRFDAYVGLMTAGSPLTFYLWASAVLSLLRPMFGVCYQVKSAKAERDTPRPTLCAAALLTLLFWIALFIYTAVPECYAAFSQVSCDKKLDFILRFPLFILLPLAFAFDTFYIHVHRGISAALVLPLFLTLAAWIVLILLWRTSIWTQETTFLAECTCQFRVIHKAHPFLHFLTVFLVPSLYWVLGIELAVYIHDQDSSGVSYGQVLSILATILPVFELCRARIRAYREHLQRGKAVDLQEGTRTQTTSDLRDV